MKDSTYTNPKQGETTRTTKNCSTCRWGPKCLMKDYVAKWCKEEGFFRWEAKIGEKGAYIHLGKEEVK